MKNGNESQFDSRIESMEENYSYLLKENQLKRILELLECDWISLKIEVANFNGEKEFDQYEKRFKMFCRRYIKIMKTSPLCTESKLVEKFMDTFRSPGCMGYSFQFVHQRLLETRNTLTLLEDMLEKDEDVGDDESNKNDYLSLSFVFDSLKETVISSLNAALMTINEDKKVEKKPIQPRNDIIEIKDTVSKESMEKDDSNLSMENQLKSLLELINRDRICFSFEKLNMKQENDFVRYENEFRKICERCIKVEDVFPLCKKPGLPKSFIDSIFSPGYMGYSFRFIYQCLFNTLNTLTFLERMQEEEDEDYDRNEHHTLTFVFNTFEKNVISSLNAALIRFNDKKYIYHSLQK